MKRDNWFAAALFAGIAAWFVMTVVAERHPSAGINDPVPSTVAP